MRTSVARAEPEVAAPSLPRSFGHARVSFEREQGGPTRLRTLFQEGCLKLRLPRSPTADSAELVVLNTAGGLTGGDALSLDVAVGEDARVTVTTPGCERIYRALAGEAAIEQRLSVRRGGRLDWLPQETILFDRGRLRRRLDVELAEGAEATIAESILLGRSAMGETVESGHLADGWTVRRGGRLLFADATRIAEPFAATVDHAATLAGRTALATVIHVGEDLGAKRDGVRAAFAATRQLTGGASVVGDILVVRLAAPGGMALRRALIPALAVLRDARPLPRSWNC